MTSRTQALLYRGGPTLFIVGLSLIAVFGDGGLVERQRLEVRAAEAKQAWLDLEASNDRLVLENLQLDRDPVQVERLVADELGLARPGATLYVFEDTELVRVR